MFESLFGKVLLVTIGALIGMSVNILTLLDRFKKFKKEEKRKKYKENYLLDNPDFKISLGNTSNPVDGKFQLHVSILNLSSEVKFLNSIVYNFEDVNERGTYGRPTMFFNGEKWPKRLEHGEDLNVAVNFQDTVKNELYNYYNRNIEVYAACSTTDNILLKSRGIPFDHLASLLNPISKRFIDLAESLADSRKIPVRNILTILWHLEMSKWMHTSIAKQLQQNGIPIVEFLSDKYDLKIVPDLWMTWQHDLNRIKISDEVVTDFLETLL